MRATSNEHWLVRWLDRHRAGRLALTVLDRPIFGGATVAISFIVTVIAAASVGWLFDTLDDDRGFARWDTAVAEWGAASATPTTTHVMRVVTQAGSSFALVIILSVLAAFDWRRRGSSTGAGFLAIVGVGIVLINNALKVLVMRERPLVPHLVSASGYSFPSGHSAAAAACWAAIAFVLLAHVPRRFRWLLVAGAVLVTALVATSRALLGVHYLSDVIAGVIVGWTWCFLVAVAFGGRIVARAD